MVTVIVRVISMAVAVGDDDGGGNNNGKGMVVVQIVTCGGWGGDVTIF